MNHRSVSSLSHCPAGITKMRSSAGRLNDASQNAGRCEVGHATTAPNPLGIMHTAAAFGSACAFPH